MRAVDAAGNVGPSATTSVTVSGATPTPTPTAAPSATPTPSHRRRRRPTPPVRRVSQLRLTRKRLKRRLVEVRGVVSRPATGTVTVRVRARRRTVRRTLKVRNGSFAVKVRLGKRQRGAKRARMTVRYSGDANYAPRRTTITIRRKRPRSEPGTPQGGLILRR